MAKTRSPNYPQISLPVAIDRARVIYGEEHLHKASEDTIAHDLGYSGLNGRSIGIISALKKYGLIEGIEDGFRISDDAQAILEFTPQTPERMEALKKAAFSPALFHDLFEEFGETLPSEANLRQFLIKRKFHPDKADEVVRVYRDTLELVTQEERNYNAFHDAAKSKGESRPAGETRMREANLRSPNAQELAQIFHPPVPGEGKELRFNISRDSEAQVIFRGPVTQEAIDKLAKMLELQKDTFPTTAELATAETSDIEPEGAEAKGAA